MNRYDETDADAPVPEWICGAGFASCTKDNPCWRMNDGRMDAGYAADHNQPFIPEDVDLGLQTATYATGYADGWGTASGAMLRRPEWAINVACAANERCAATKLPPLDLDHAGRLAAAYEDGYEKGKADRLAAG